MLHARQNNPLCAWKSHFVCRSLIDSKISLLMSFICIGRNSGRFPEMNDRSKVMQQTLLTLLYPKVPLVLFQNITKGFLLHVKTQELFKDVSNTRTKGNPIIVYDSLPCADPNLDLSSERAKLNLTTTLCEKRTIVLASTLSLVFFPLWLVLVSCLFCLRLVLEHVGSWLNTFLPMKHVHFIGIW